MTAVSVVAVLAAAKEPRPVYPEPKLEAKFNEFEVCVIRNPNWSPLEVETRTRWRIERELSSWQEPHYKIGNHGLLIEVLYVYYSEPREPFPPRRRALIAPPSRGGGFSVIGPQAVPVLDPGIGQAKIQITFKSRDGTILSKFEIVRPVLGRLTDFTDEESFMAQTGRVCANYARYYFLEAPR